MWGRGSAGADWDRTNYDAMSYVYDVGRAMPEEWVTDWRLVLREFLDDVQGPIVDVGSGTGIWATFFADWFGADVVAVEPSEGMRRRAIRSRHHPRVSYVGGEAAQLPLQAGSCGALWMSTVIHHVPDLRGAAHEARRCVINDRS